MKIAELLVDTGRGGEEPEEWGSYGFVDLPSAGDRLTVERDGARDLVVSWVHHHPVARLDRRSSPGLGLPQARVWAKIA